MTLAQRLGKVGAALLSVLAAWILLKLGEEGFLLVGFLLSVSLIAFGLRNVIFYCTMARHMVGGRSVLYIGVIVLDFGVFTMTISRHYGLFIILYLLATYAFSGAIDILRALEARRFEAPSWRLNLAEGTLNIAFAGAAVYFGLLRGNMRELTIIYAAGLIYSAVLKLISALRKTAIVYIQ